MESDKDQLEWRIAAKTIGWSDRELESDLEECLIEPGGPLVVSAQVV